jgi:hypothetical protein
VPRYELPPDLEPGERRAVLAALDQALGGAASRSEPWALAGRVEALRLGALQARRDLNRPWEAQARIRFARRGTEPQVGRGDAR